MFHLFTGSGVKLEGQKGNGNWLVRGDVDGDGVSDFRIDIDDFGGVLDVSDFLL